VDFFLAQIKKLYKREKLYASNPNFYTPERIREARNDEYTNSIVNSMHVKLQELISKGEYYFPPVYTIRLYRPVSRSVATSGTSSWTMSGLGIKVEGTRDFEKLIRLAFALAHNKIS